MMRIESVGVVGLGTMGAGIVEVFARGGVPVVGVETTAELAEQGRGLLTASVERAVARGRLDEAAGRAALEAVTVTTDLADLAQVDLVVEAVPERMEVKREVMRRLDAVTGPGAILATNTSSLSVTEIAAVTERRERVVGMHFFNPAPVQRLVEVIRTAVTDPEVVEAVRELAERIGKVPVVVADRAGFVANHLLFGYMNRAGQLYFDGVVSREDLDAAMQVGAGLPMGPLALMDLVGLDVCSEIGGVIHALTHKDMHAPSQELATMVRAGLLGRKSGVGFYPYSPEAKAAEESRAAAPATPREVTSVGVVGAGERADDLAAALAGAGVEVVRIEAATADLSALAGVQVVVEAAEVAEPEDEWLVDVPLAEHDAELTELLIEFGRVLPEGAAVVSLSADGAVEVAALTGRHDASVRGVLHDATPAGRVIELGRLAGTSPEVLATLRAVLGAAGLTPVVVRDQPGLVVESLMGPFLNEAVLMAQSGYATPEEIDSAMRFGCGYPMGPFAMIDHWGADRVLDIVDELFATTGDPGLAPAAELVERATLNRPFGA
ncbi:3-hydroxyacyl-CoA dehydrogenase NAD-binding domain-containing protein [Kytococcus aerolatus]|nr:3-hydroxyacyl-CoA dehydrogenase NAD-binding domain-containing protein [Kytococcus aerolatus]